MNLAHANMTVVYHIAMKPFTQRYMRILHMHHLTWWFQAPNTKYMQMLYMVKIMVLCGSNPDVHGANAPAHDGEPCHEHALHSSCQLELESSCEVVNGPVGGEDHYMDPVYDVAILGA